MTTTTRVRGVLKTGASGLFNGWIRVTPDAPIIDNTSNPSLIVLPISEKSNIVNSILDFTVVPSNDITYKLEIGATILVAAEQLEILNTDGSVKTPYSAAVYRDDIYFNWHSLIPLRENITLEMLLPIQVQTGHIDQSYFRVAEILRANPDFRASLINIFRPMGIWSNSTWYSKFDFVFFNGVTYVCIAPVPGDGSITPNIDTAHWQQFTSNLQTNPTSYIPA
jgi:hypothetical protein